MIIFSKMDSLRKSSNSIESGREIDFRASWKFMNVSIVRWGINTHFDRCLFQLPLLKASWRNSFFQRQTMQAQEKKVLPTLCSKWYSNDKLHTCIKLSQARVVLFVASFVRFKRVPQSRFKKRTDIKKRFEIVWWQKMHEDVNLNKAKKHPQTQKLPLPNSFPNS